MKKNTFALLCYVLLVLNISLAQDYVQLPTQNAKWLNGHYTETWTPGNPVPDLALSYIDYFCVDGSDTVISTNSYTKIVECNTSEYIGAYRELTDSVVYFIPKDSTADYVIYDFSANVGDTVHDVWETAIGLHSWIVSSLTTTAINGINRLTIELCDENNECTTWISGIGGTKGFLRGQTTNVSGAHFDLLCMSSNDTSFFPSFLPNSACEIYLSADNFEVNPTTIEVFPNPSPDGFYTISIDHLMNPLEYTLIDNLGREMKKGNITSAEEVLDLSDEPQGIYFLIISNDERIKIIKSSK